jgi:hypothetical protein
MTTFTFQIWAITIGGSVLQNELSKRVNLTDLGALGTGESLLYSAIPSLHKLPQDILPVVQEAFAQSLQTLWYMRVGTAGFGLLISLAMREVPLHSKVDEKWDIEHKKSTSTSSSEIPETADTQIV